MSHRFDSIVCDHPECRAESPRIPQRDKDRFITEVMALDPLLQPDRFHELMIARMQILAEGWFEVTTGQGAVSHRCPAHEPKAAFQIGRFDGVNPVAVVAKTARPTWDEATNAIETELVRVLKEEYAEAQKRTAARIQGMVASLPDVLGDGWNMTGDPEAVAQEFVEAAARVSEGVVSDWGMSNFIGQGNLTVELDLEVRERYMTEILDLARTVLADVPGATVMPNEYFGVNRIDINIPHVGGRRYELEGRLKEMLRTWSVDRNTSQPSLFGIRQEDEDDNYKIDITL